MGRCDYIKDDGSRCNFAGDKNDWFFFRDSHDIFSGVIEVCHMHSQMVFSELIAREEVAKQTLKHLALQYKSIIKSGYEVAGKRIVRRDYSEMTVYLEDGTSVPFSVLNKINSGNTQKQRQEDKKVVGEKISKFKGILNQIRNKECRFCGHLLDDPTCNDCKKRQWSDKYTTCDLKSWKNLRRVDLLFHTLCGRIWLQAKFGVKILPSKSGQYTIEQTTQIV